MLSCTDQIASATDCQHSLFATSVMLSPSGSPEARPLSSLLRLPAISSAALSHAFQAWIAATFDHFQPNPYSISQYVVKGLWSYLRIKLGSWKSFWFIFVIRLLFLVMPWLSFWQLKIIIQIGLLPYKNS